MVTGDLTTHSQHSLRFKPYSVSPSTVGEAEASWSRLCTRFIFGFDQLPNSFANNKL